MGKRKRKEDQNGIGVRNVTTPAELHTELWTDPESYHGKQDSLQPYVDSLAKLRDPTDPRPITVNIRTPDKVAPGVVSEPLNAQSLRDSIDIGEYNANCEPTAGDDAVVIGQKAALRDLLNLLLMSIPESDVAFTDGLQDQLLAVFTNADWPLTRAALLGQTARDGSRSEELYGVQASRADVDAAQRYGLSLDPVQDLTKKP